MGLGNPSRADDSHAEGMVIGPFFTPGGVKLESTLSLMIGEPPRIQMGKAERCPRMLDDAGIILVLERFVEIVFLKGL